MQKKLSIYTFLLLCLTFITINQGHAEEFAGKLVSSEGTVLFSLDKGNSWQPVTPSMEFPEGAYIKVESDGEAALMLNDRSQIRLSAGSVLYLKKTGSAPGDEVNKAGILEIFSGKLWFRNKRKGSKPVFATPVVSASIRGTEMAIAVADDGTSDITVLEGHVQCINQHGEAVIARGEGVKAQRGAAPVVVKLLKPENSVQWLLLTPDIVGPADADFVKTSDAVKNSMVDSNIDLNNSSAETNGINLAQKAMELLAQGEAESLETAQNAVKLAPKRASTHAALATVLQSKGKFEEALQEAEKAAALDPLSVPALIRNVELLLGLDNVAKAERKISTFNTQSSKDVRVDMLKGYISLIKLDSERAEKEFRQVIEQKNDLSSAYLGLGLALYHQKKRAEGLDNMEKACLLEPLAAYPHTYLAKAQYELGERYEAEVELRRAATLDPYDPTPHMYLATMLSDTYRPGEGIKSLEKSIALNDNKLMSRSRYLLDQDRASKNISLAWSLTTMGLYEWADAKGDQAVWDDESNSSAYLFRASRALILGQFDADLIGDMKRAELLKPVNANAYTSYNEYQNLLETPEIKSSITLNAGTDNTGNGTVTLNGGNTRTAFYGFSGYNTTDGPFDNTGRSSSEGLLSIKQVITSGHEIIADARVIKGEMEYDNDSTSFHDSLSLLGAGNTNKDSCNINGSFGYHWHQGAGSDMMILLQSEKYDVDKMAMFEKYISSIDITQYQNNKIVDDRDSFGSEIVQLFKISNQGIGRHSISTGISQSKIDSSSYSESKTFYNESGFPMDLKTDNSDYPDKKESRLFARDIWSLSNTLKFDLGISWCELEDIFLSDDKKLEDKHEWLPHIGFMWKVSPDDTIKVGYFKEAEPHYLSGSLQPVEVAGFSKILGSLQGTLTEFYGVGWDKNWTSQFFTRTEIYHQNRHFPDIFTSHAGEFNNAKEQLNISWDKETQDIGRLIFEYLMTDNVAISVIYQVTDHNTESGVERNRVDHNVATNLTWVHSSGVRVQNTLWYVNQDEKSGYTNPVDENFIIASISAEKALFDKRLLLVAKWENIFDEKYNYLISDTTESSHLPWQGSFATLGLQWNF
ncbi:MAG: FecR domain-containing protein [Desulfamplus sp.]